MPRTRAENSTPTNARVTFSDNSPSNTTAANTYIIKHRDDSVCQCRGCSRRDLQTPLIQVFHQEIVGNSNWKRCYFKRGARVIRNNEDRLKEVCLNLFILAGLKRKT